MKNLIQKIAGRLSGMNFDDLTTAERQIVVLLFDNGILTKDDNGDLHEVDAVEGYFATIKVLIRADSESEACDVLSETLRQPNAIHEGGVVDWTYLRENDTLTPVVTNSDFPVVRYHSPSKALIPLDYDEGSGFRSEKC